MRLIAMIAIGLLSVGGVSGAFAQPLTTGYSGVYRGNPPTPGEPPAVVLALTGVAGVAFVARRKRFPGDLE